MAPQHKDSKAGPGGGPASKSKSKAKGASGATLASNNNSSNKANPPAHALKKEPAPHQRVIPTENVNIDPNMNPVPGPTATVQHHPHHQQQGPPPAHIQQHPRPSSIVHQQQQHHPGSPHQQTQAQHQGPYNSPHLASHGVPIQQQQHQAPYPPQAPGPNGQPHPEVAYYGSHPSPYGTPGSTQYSSSENPDLMAAAHMQRPNYPQIYHTPQSNSPASVASPQGHDAHGRPTIYGQPQSQMPQGMYGYPSYPPPMNQNQPSPYAVHPAQHQPLLMSHQQNQQPMHQQPPPNAAQNMSNSPRPKLEPSAMGRPLDPATMQQQQQQQRQPPPQMHPNGNTQTAPPTSNGLQQGPPGPGGVNSNAAPGPIPATTPLVVRQDNNGVQWIAFEYSRDRVKMEYTIRCDVESVNVDNLSQEFKTENCVYPRACCGKDQYRGNRLIYETECNTVGWALAELNPCLRGKRGLIQRAVDSWRNSNRDPKLRSRRVRRMAKLNNRKQTTHPPGHMAGPGGPVAAPVPTANPMAAPLQRQPQPNMNMGGGQLHHHHNHPDGQPQGDDVSGSNPSDLRPSHVFNGYPSPYPNQSGMGSSMAPPLHDGMDGLGSHPSGPSAVPVKRKASEDAETTAALYGDLPESKRRKFILVDDTQRNSRVRVRVTLDQVEMKEMPDSYRKANSVFPRAYYPMQMQDIDDKPRDPRVFADDDTMGGSADGNSEEPATLSRTLVPVPLLGEDADSHGQIAVPKIGRSKRKRESTLNELGYRMSWSQSRVFAGRILFLQKSLDAYRNKMRSTIIQNATSVPGKEAEAPHVAQHFETRVGKRRWLERGRRAKRDVSP